MNSTTTKELEAVARAHGHAAATWAPIEDIDSARFYSEKLEDCELEIPAPLTGEWSGESTRELFEEAGIDIDDLDDQELDELSTTYEMAYEEAYVFEVEKMIAVHLSGYIVRLVWPSGVELEQVSTGRREWCGQDEDGELALRGLGLNPEEWEPGDWDYLQGTQESIAAEYFTEERE